jgi:D-alanine transaminase
MPRYSYVNGRYLPHERSTVHIEDRGFQFADSVYEMIALVDGRALDEEGHLDRLERSLSELRMAAPVSRVVMKMIMRELIRRNRMVNGAVYIQVSRGTAPRDFKFPKGAAPTLVMTVRPLVYDIDARKKSGRKVVTVPDIRWQRRDVKTTGLLAQVLAKQHALDRGVFDAWMVDDEGFVTEASASNAWIVDKKGRLITRPTAGNAILKGVTRNALQRLCRKEKIELVERPFSVKEAYAATEAFASAASALIVPVIEIDGKKIGGGKIGPVTSKVFDLYMNYATDKEIKQESWNPK